MKDVSEEYRRRADRYSKIGSGAMLLIAVPIALWSMGVTAVAPLGASVVAGAGLLAWARGSFRCPSCERVLPRQTAETNTCPFCEAVLRPEQDTEGPREPA